MLPETKEQLTNYGFRGFKKIKYLINECKEIPHLKGVFLILNYSEDIKFLEKSTGGFFKSKDPNINILTLESRWVNETSILCIGSAGSDFEKTTLNSKIKKYLNFGTGKASGHFFWGRYVWQIENASELLIAWKPLPTKEDCELEKTKLNNEFIKKYLKSPFATEERQYLEVQQISGKYFYGSIIDFDGFTKMQYNEWVPTYLINNSEF